MKTIKLVILVAIALLSIITACNQKNQVEKLKAEVMAIHDEVMPEMGTLMNLQKELKDRISHLHTTDKSMADSLNRLVSQLEEADETMMQWMRNYKDPSPEMGEEEALEYLKSKKESITEVKNKINTSKATAQAVLNN